VKHWKTGDWGSLPDRDKSWEPVINSHPAIVINSHHGGLKLLGQADLMLGMRGASAHGPCPGLHKSPDELTGLNLAFIL